MTHQAIFLDTGEPDREVKAILGPLGVAFMRGDLCCVGVLMNHPQSYPPWPIQTWGSGATFQIAIRAAARAIVNDGLAEKGARP